MIKKRPRDEREAITINFLGNMIKKQPDQFLLIAGEAMSDILKKKAKKSGFMKFTKKDKRKSPVWSIFFVTDPKLMKILKDAVRKYGKGKE